MHANGHEFGLSGGQRCFLICVDLRPSAFAALRRDQSAVVVLYAFRVIQLRVHSCPFAVGFQLRGEKGFDNAENGLA
jgi:hypothetical protein